MNSYNKIDLKNEKYNLIYINRVKNERTMIG